MCAPACFQSHERGCALWVLGRRDWLSGCQIKVQHRDIWIQPEPVLHERLASFTIKFALRGTELDRVTRWEVVVNGKVGTVR